MKRQRRAARCPNCGAESTGKFCNACGSLQVALVAEAQEQGAGISRITVAGAVAVVALTSFFIGRISASGAAEPGETSLATRPVASLAALPPQERASRLYDEVMRYGEAGRLDSARLLAPSAILAYEALRR